MKCTKTISNGWHRHPCSRNAVINGYCKQHHPESVKKRQQKSEELYETNRNFQLNRDATFFIKHYATKQQLIDLLTLIQKTLHKIERTEP